MEEDTYKKERELARERLRREDAEFDARRRRRIRWLTAGLMNTPTSFHVGPRVKYARERRSITQDPFNVVAEAQYSWRVSDELPGAELNRFEAKANGWGACCVGFGSRTKATSQFMIFSVFD